MGDFDGKSGHNGGTVDGRHSTGAVIKKSSFEKFKTMGNFKKLRVWQEALGLATDIYEITSNS